MTLLPVLIQPAADTNKSSHLKNSCLSSRSYKLPLLSRSNNEPLSSTSARGHDGMKTPNENSIDKIRNVTTQIQACLHRMNQTQENFEQKYENTRELLERICMQQNEIVCVHLLKKETSTLNIQRVFRGFLGRRIYRQSLVLQAALRIQRAFRATRLRRVERKQRLRIISHKVLRGLRRIVQLRRKDMNNVDVLERVNHNIMIEKQWEIAMGVAGTEEETLQSQLHRRRVQRRLAAAFRVIRVLHSIVRFWQSLTIPSALDAISRPFLEVMEDADVVQMDAMLAGGDKMEIEAAVVIGDKIITEQSVQEVSGAMSPNPLPRSTFGLSKSTKRGSAMKSPRKSLPRDELRSKQRLYIQYVREENLKKEAVRIAFRNSVQNAIRNAELEKKQHEEEKRKLRVLHAEAKREDLERRAVLLARDLRLTKDEELRKDEEVQLRLVTAKQKIAREVLSGETQKLILRKAALTLQSPRKSSTTAEKISASERYQRAARKRDQIPGNEQRRGFYEVEFSNAEQSILKSRQKDSLQSISRVLDGRSEREVQRRCLELGLSCGGDVAKLPEKSEKWRTRRHQRE